MYVAVKGGEKAIESAHKLLARKRRGDRRIPELSVAQIREQLGLAVDRVMTEGSLYDPELAALAIKQACGDLVEAVFLLRAYRTTLPRLAVSEPLDTGRVFSRRRISAAFKDLPGGQVLGPTFDYTHRLLDFSLLSEAGARAEDGEDSPDVEIGEASTCMEPCPRVLDMLGREGLVEQARNSGEAVGDLTREPLRLPAERDVRLQNLARGDEGFILALGYSVQRGFGSGHPFTGEIRMGEVEVEIVPEELGFPVALGEITVTECEMISKFNGSGSIPPQFTRGYGLAFGCCERKAMSMALVDRSLRFRELEEQPKGPAQDEEFVLCHSDNVEASGFVQHLKLPHHVDFQGELSMLRALRRKHDSGKKSASGRTDAGEAMAVEAESK
ncbi:MAG: carbon-phosphorus lyase complex subunit PhnI [Desulfocurvibacter africanus]